MSHRIYQFAEAFIARGHEVMIVGASYSHVRRINPETHGFYTRERIDGIEYRWLRTPRYRGNGVGRVIHMLIYRFLLWFYAGRLAREFHPDVVICAGVETFDIYGCVRIAKKARARLIYEVRDLWPLTPIMLGDYSPKHPFIQMMQKAENYAYRHADAVVSLLPDAHEHMIEHGLGSKPFYFIPNGVVAADWQITDPGEEGLKRHVQDVHLDILRNAHKEGKVVIGYVGTLNLANDIDILIHGFGRLKRDDTILVLVGSGMEEGHLKSIIARERYSNIFFLGQQPKQDIPYYLSLIDIAYLGMKRSPLVFTFGMSPNKIYDYMMAGKPIVQAIDAANNIVEIANCGIYAEPDNVEAVRNAIQQLIDMGPEKRRELGENGREYVLSHNTYDVLTDEYLRALSGEPPSREA
jgi:wblI protein